MRHTSTLALALAASSLSAQIQNGGFEALDTLDMPAFWTPGIQLIPIGDSIVFDSAKYLLNTTDVHSGLNAIELRNYYNYTQDLGSAGVWFATSSESGYGGFPSPEVPVDERPQTVHFWAKYAPVQDDTGYVEVTVMGETHDQIGLGTLMITGSMDVYTAFEVPIEYTLTDSAAFIGIRFSTMIPTGNPHLGTRMLIDDVEVNHSAASIPGLEAAAVQLFPNPATDEVRITGLIAGPPAMLTVMDAAGRVVFRHTSTNGMVSLREVPPGAYGVRIEQNGVVFLSKLVVAR